MPSQNPILLTSRAPKSNTHFPRAKILNTTLLCIPHAHTIQPNRHKTSYSTLLPSLLELNMDDLLALMEDDKPDELQRIPTRAREEGKPARRREEAAAIGIKPKKKYPSQQRPPPPPSTSRAEASVDAKIGIRMIKRMIGSIDLLDLLSTNPYHSPAALVKMTTFNLNQLLQDPSPVVDVATVTGRTNLLTIGIVFTNSGTRISKSGRAFSILEIGSLVTGPIATVFLFGDVYSKHGTVCVPGTVVALLNPSIVPPKENSSSKDNSLSLSVGDARQLLPVAQAQDYGVCKGASKAKRHDGRFTEFACKHHVDTRNGLYCSKHIQQGKKVNSHGKTVTDQSFLQKTRQEMPKQTAMADLLNPNRSNMTYPVFQVQPTNPFLSKAPKNMVKGQIKTKMETPPRKNPYQKKPSLQALASRPTVPKGKPLASNWLNVKAQSDKKRTVNRFGGGFDGGVMVPKAHKMFRATTSTVQQQAQRPSFAESAQEQEQSLRDRQKSLSSAFHDKTDVAPSLSQRLKSLKPKAPDAASSNAFFAGLDIDVNAVLNAKSRFETEAKAEDYARRRKVVTELEKSEERDTKKEAKKSQNQSQAKVRREWLCVNCKRTTGIDPKICKRLGHTVKFKRHIEETKTLTEKRLQLQDKSVEDGGILLGAGVEWTNYMNT